MEVTIKTSSPVVRSYWNTLRNLRSETKVELISLLAQSLTMPSAEKKDHWADKFYGAWEDDKSAEDMAAEIRDSRMTGTRQIAAFE